MSLQRDSSLQVADGESDDELNPIVEAVFKRFNAIEKLQSSRVNLLLNKPFLDKYELSELIPYSSDQIEFLAKNKYIHWYKDLNAGSGKQRKLFKPEDVMNIIESGRVEAKSRIPLQLKKIDRNRKPKFRRSLLSK